MALSSPSFITEPWPNCFSIWITAASSAAARAFVSFGSVERSGVGVFVSVISSSLLLRPARIAGRQIEAREGYVLGPLRAENRTVESEPDASERLEKLIGQRRERIRDRHRATAAATPGRPLRRPLRADSGERHVRPERPLLGLVQARR